MDQVFAYNALDSFRSDSVASLFGVGPGGVVDRSTAALDARNGGTSDVLKRTFFNGKFPE